MIRKGLPILRHHKASNRGYVFLNNKRIYLGKWPNQRLSPPERLNQAYHLFLSNLTDKKTSNNKYEKKRKPKKLVDLCQLFLNSKISSGDTNNYRVICKFITKLFPKTMIEDFGPFQLQDLQKEFIANGLSRQGINKRINLTRRIFRWGISQNLVNSSTMEALRTIFPVKKGTAPESKYIGPADISHVNKTLLFLHPILQAMVYLQILTGMRPSEVCKIRTIDIDDSNATCWWYRPPNHKNTWRGQIRSIPLVGKALHIIKDYLLPDFPEKQIFSPKNRDRVSSKAGDFYTTSEYGKAIRNATIRAKVEPWAPNQLRKYAAQKLLEEQGLEAAASLLGHTCIEITRRHYTKQAENRAKTAAEFLATVFPHDGST